tara:strand:+ start:3657 stop:3872 length:216 start_codon:yes stop_codon:yes gene_type:complete
MKSMLLLILLLTVLTFLGIYSESKKEPYDVGIHWDYSIICENGFIYKQMRHGTIQILNSDGTPLVCGEKIY